MEYHFTGTGDSLDVTFIADGIIDGSGKVIPYPAIKSIKVKRKGNESVLMITAEENDTKVEYCYSVAPKDEESLKKAVADITETVPETGTDEIVAGDEEVPL